jgi:hypothetical protein
MAEKKKDYEQFSTTLPTKFIKLLRLQAFKAETSLSDMLQDYQKVYVEKTNSWNLREKLKKQLIAGYRTNVKNKELQKELEIYDEAVGDGLSNEGK